MARFWAVLIAPSRQMDAHRAHLFPWAPRRAREGCRNRAPLPACPHRRSAYLWPVGKDRCVLRQFAGPDSRGKKGIAGYLLLHATRNRIHLERIRLWYPERDLEVFWRFSVPTSRSRSKFTRVAPWMRRSGAFESSNWIANVSRFAAPVKTSSWI